jgi:heptosyltransferase III
MKPALNVSDPSSLLPSLPQGTELLIVRLRSMGDVVMTTPALAALHAWRPDLRLVVLVEPAWAPLLEGNPAVSETLIRRAKAATAWQLRRRRFPIVFNQHSGPTSALLVAATRAPARVCWVGRQFSFLYNVLVPGPAEFFGTNPVHTAEHRVTQFYWTGLPRGPAPPASVFPQPDARAAVERILQARGISSGAYAVLQPGARSFTKRWSAEKFAAIARWLREEYRLEPIVSLGPGEGQIAEEVGKYFDPSNVVLDSLNLRELIALLAGARLYVGNDAGPMHLAAALQRPVVAIFGSSKSLHWRPWRTKHRVVQSDFPCDPSSGILSVTVEQVQKACEDLLAESTA